ncbi:MAG: DUF6067 family protein [Planctomycetia bacterium]|nr:DUF6067 family protein [Planctomycetia bacterium]
MKKYRLLKQEFVFELILAVFALLGAGSPLFALPGTEPDENGVCRFDFSIPNSWKLDSGEAAILPSADGVQGAVLQVKGNGKGGNRWVLSGFPYKKVYEASPQHLCMFRFKVRAVDKMGGSCMAGPLFSFKDFPISESWKTCSMIFPLSERINKDAVRLILYAGRSTLQFAEAEILPVFASFGDQKLASGEKYDPQAGTWLFQSQFNEEGGSWSPALQDFKASFNTNRWSFGEGAYLTYCFQAPENELFNGGQITVNIGYYSSGALLTEYSFDGKIWKKAGEITQSASAQFDFPKEKTKKIWIRFLGGPKCGLQINSFRVSADLLSDSGKIVRSKADTTICEGAPRAGSIVRGRTVFWEVVKGDYLVPLDLLASLKISNAKSGEQIGEQKLQWKDKNGKDHFADLRCRYYNNDYYRTDYGVRLQAPGEKEIGFWWTDSTHKICPERKIPSMKIDQKGSQSLYLEAAANDRESVQLVLYPKNASTIGSVQIGDFESASGKTISAENVEVRRVYYHDVQAPSDRISAIGLLPDALPPLTENVKIAAKTNFPIWLTVNVPSKTAAGDYTGSVSISIRSDQDQEAKVRTFPIKLHVWNFELPELNTVETSFGFNPSLCWKYHHISKQEDKVRLLDKYFRLLGRNRISVYDPMPFSPVGRKYVVDKEHPEKSYAVLDFTAFDQGFEAAMKNYRMNRARLSLPGMGGGTFVSRIEPQIAGHKLGSPEFEALFASVARQTEQHLIEKGWIDQFYLYWFDEPEEKDFPFVRDGMKRVKKYAPRIRTMLTTEPRQGFAGDAGLGKIDVWAMIIDRYDSRRAEECKAQNEILWTYMTNVPTPYCTQFMEHSAADLRVWLWQSWKFNCPGVLIWTINYWTSSTAFPDPDHPQNPYLDPGVYQTGYGLAKGAKHLWGNGDARMVYPPLSCAVPAKEANFDDPVPSIRLEMIREGIEDYEMLVLLKKKLAERKDLSPARKAELEKLLEVPTEITSDWTRFTTDPQPIYRHRAKVAKAIEELNK